MRIRTDLHQLEIDSVNLSGESRLMKTHPSAKGEQDEQVE